MANHSKQTSDSSFGKLSRRRFLGRVAAGSAATLAAPFIVPASALGRDGNVAPSERIVIGCIGNGGRGTHIMKILMAEKDVQIVAVADVEARSNLYFRGRTAGREPAREAVNKHYAETAPDGKYSGCKAFADFRELLDIKDIDAVSVTTPDHWHALASVAAANAGKDIYCEKPLANSIGEGRAICDAVKKNNRILQTGSHERSNNKGRYACELVRNGRIGKLHTVRIQMPSNDDHHQEVKAVKGMPPTREVPAGLDYNFWLGHTPEVPYMPERCHFWWRFVLAHGGGEMTDRGAHIIDLAQLGMGTDATGPVEIETHGKRGTGLYDAFMDYEFTNVYANGVRMIGESEGPRGVKFEGTDGWVFINIHGCRLEASRPSLLEEVIGEGEIQLGRSPGHQRDFLNCVKSRKAPLAKAETGHRTASVCHLNNISALTGRKLRWDPVKERFIGDASANEHVMPTMRAPWAI
jgi:predicted dehydrogenase